MVKSSAILIWSLVLLGCTQPLPKQPVADTKKGIAYETANGKITDVYDTTPNKILPNSSYYKYICEKKAVYAGMASHDEYTTYKKTYLGENLVKFEVVGKSCKVI